MFSIFKKYKYEFKYVATAYRSNGYIHLVWTEPSIRALCTRWMGRCSITSKNAGGKIFSSLLVITTILLSIRARFSSFNVVARKFLKNKLISAIGFHMFSGKPIKDNHGFWFHARFLVTYQPSFPNLRHIHRASSNFGLTHIFDAFGPTWM